MSSRLTHKTQCPKCLLTRSDSSGDNLAIYADGHGYCFAGHGYFSRYLLTSMHSPCIDAGVEEKKTHKEYSLSTKEIKESIDIVNYKYTNYRGLIEETYRFYDVSTKYLGDTPVSHGYIYPNGAIKVRQLPKGFSWVGPANEAGLFGTDKFQAGSAKSITITEGELDALSVFQMLGSKYPAVSVRSSTSARTDCQRAWDYLNSYERIYLCFDGDDAGARATAEVAGLFNPNKIFDLKLSKHKDANAYLQAGDTEEFKRAWWNARPYLPKGIIGDYQSIEEALSKQDQASIASYPFSTLNSMAYGVRAGELVLLTAQEKIGKTEVLRAIEHHILKTTDLNIGIIHLEETEKRSVQGLAGYELGVPAHLPDASVSNSDVLEAYKGLTRRDGRCFYYTHFGSSDPSVIIDRIRYLVTVCGCKCVFLDHLTRLVSGNPDDDVRRTLDWLATELAILCRDLQFCLFLICHVNDAGQPRDSRMIAKECNMHIYLSRDKESSDPNVRNRVDVMVRDNRFGSTTGPAGVLSFDPKTFKLTEIPPAIQEIDFDPTI